jgi:lipocalin
LLTANVLAKRRVIHRGQGQLKNEECQKFNFQEDFNSARFNGMWYEVMAYPFCLTNNAKCVISSYAFGSDRNISIYSRFVNSQGLETRIIGMAAERSPGVLAVMFSAARKFSKLFYAFEKFKLIYFSAEAASFHHILSTDYENFAIVAACNSLCGAINGINVWVLSRKPSLELKYLTEVIDVLNDNEIQYSFLKRTVQDCNFSFMF